MNQNQIKIKTKLKIPTAIYIENFKDKCFLNVWQSNKIY